MSLAAVAVRVVLSIAFGAFLGAALRDGVNGWLVAALCVAYGRTLLADLPGAPHAR